MNKLKLLIESYIQVSNDELEKFFGGFYSTHIKKNGIILQASSICRNLYFVINGLLRTYFVDKDNQEHNFHFCYENTFAGDYESFIKHTPSSYTIQAVEPTELIVIPYETLLKGFNILKEGERLGRMLAEEYFIMFSDKLRSFYTESPLERFNKLDKLYPNIHQRVPQRHIASYLNISSVHLSRLKNHYFLK